MSTDGPAAYERHCAGEDAEYAAHMAASLPQHRTAPTGAVLHGTLPLMRRRAIGEVLGELVTFAAWILASTIVGLLLLALAFAF